LPQVRLLRRSPETFSTELAHGLQQPVAAPVRRVFSHDPGLVDQAAENIQDSGQWSVVSGRCWASRTDHWPLTTGHYLSRFQVPTAGEHREPPEQSPLRLRQQVVAPTNRRAEGLLVRNGGAAADE